MDRAVFLAMASAIISALSAGAALAQAAPQDVFDAFFATPQSRGACYIRSYSSDHLRTHPKQRVSEILLAPSAKVEPQRQQQFRLDLAVRQRASRQGFVGVAYCTASADGRARCLLEGDGGRFRLRMLADGRLRIDARWLAIEGRSGVFEFGRGISDDTVFLLDRIGPGACVMQMVRFAD